MFQHILVAVDESDLSLKAVETASGLAQAIGARLTIYYCAPDFLGEYLGDVPELKVRYSSREFRDAVHKHSNRILKRAAEHAVVKAETHADLDENPNEAIPRAASRLKCDLIVMASHGRHEDEFRGPGTTKKVLDGTRLPVLVVH